ncbi:UNVERIFIED_CONTAM: hypothetical protein Slati_2735800 [Sesamum latifolium]|uniref:Reverse transcriptase n=1 Tax=Sesamum latifolium TaxID=2727402 RepID=A0AAW2VYQ4_9LAMI
MFTRNTPSPVRDELAHVLGVIVKQTHVKYLGLPSTVGRPKREVFEGVKDRFWQKLNGWATKKRSQAGRVVLIKSVLQAIPSYVMKCFEILESNLKELEGMMAIFFWQGGGEAKIHWMACHKLCRSKDEGGLGFHRLKEINKAMLTKQAWRIVMQPNSFLHQFFQHIYFSKCKVFNAESSSSMSFTWQSILRTKDLVAAGLRWRMGDWRSVQIVGVPWLPRPLLFQVISKPKLLPESSLVDVLLDEYGWNEGLVREEFSQVDAECILSIPLPREHRCDKLIWHYGKQGRFGESRVFLSMLTAIDSHDFGRF